MPEMNNIKPVDLLIDEQNPRISQPNVGQRKAAQAIVRPQEKKLLVLAKDILRNGLNPADLPIVVPFKNDLKRYVVLEGNRRLVALKVLENPDSLGDAVSPGVLKQFRKLSKEYQDNPIESIQCLVVADRNEAQHWIELRHTGQNLGAGIVEWGADESARFHARTVGLEIHSQALNFLEERGVLTPDDRRKVPTTSLKRLLGTPEVRSKLGVEVQDGKLCLLASPKPVAKALLHVVHDLASGNTKVKDIYEKHQRVQYANKLPADIIVSATVPSGHGVPVDAKATGVKTKPRATAKIGRPRDKLIPSDCVLNITGPRIQAIERELRELKLSQYANAVSVLLRVFIELSADAYIDRVKPAGISEKDKLFKKLLAVTQDLLTRKKLTPQQAKPVRRACAKDSFLAPSIDLMHDYVHNQHVFPVPGDLRAHWGSLQPFIVAMWAP